MIDLFSYRGLRMAVFVQKWLKFRNVDSVFFLLLAIGINVSFKSALGLFLTFNGYGFSIVSPPWAFFFAAFDVLIATGTFFVFDKIPLRALRIGIWHSIITFSVIFLYSNYLIYEYFGTFLNWGLICFNGAGFRELASYVINSFNGFVLLLSFAFLICLSFSVKRKLAGLLFKHQGIVLLMVIFNIASFIFLSHFGRAETGRMVRNPAVEFIKSAANEIIFQKDADISEDFEPPRNPVFGKYPPLSPLPENFSHNNIENVVIIMVESMSLEMTAIANKDERSFAIIDKLKDSSVIFNSYRTVFPGTGRSFIAANCGSYPGTAHETITNYMVDFRCSSLAQTFNKARVSTAFFGSPLFTYDNLSNGSFAKKYSVFKDYNTLKKKYGDDGKLYSYQVQDSDTAGEAFEFMTETAKSGRRFFTFVFLYATHYPYSSPLSKNEKRGSIESYRLTQSYLSGVIEDLMGKMDSASILQNTAVIITSDHGEAFGKRKGVSGHGHSLYEESIKIPLLIYLPGLKKGVVSNKSGTHVDLAPTIAAIAGLEPEEDWQGINLLDEKSSSAPAFIYTRSSTKLNGVIDGNYKYIYNVTDRTEQLFDLDDDPDELKNIAKEKAEEAAYYKDLVRNWAAYQQKWITSAGRGH